MRMAVGQFPSGFWLMLYHVLVVFSQVHLSRLASPSQLSLPPRVFGFRRERPDGNLFLACLHPAIAVTAVALLSLVFPFALANWTQLCFRHLITSFLLFLHPSLPPVFARMSGTAPVLGHPAWARLSPPFLALFCGRGTAHRPF